MTQPPPPPGGWYLPGQQQPTTQPPARRAGRPWWQNVWLYIAVGALFVGLAMGAAGGGGSKTKTVAGPTVTATATTTATAVVTTTPTIQRVIATHTQTVRVVYTPTPKAKFSDGTYQVGRDIPAGRYRTPGSPDGCYWAVLNSTDTSDIADNDNFNGPAVVDVSNGKFFEVSGGCEWALG